MQIERCKSGVAFCALVKRITKCFMLKRARSLHTRPLNLAECVIARLGIGIACLGYFFHLQSRGSSSMLTNLDVIVYFKVFLGCVKAA